MRSVSFCRRAIACALILLLTISICGCSLIDSGRDSSGAAISNDSSSAGVSSASTLESSSSPAQTSGPANASAAGRDTSRPLTSGEFVRVWMEQTNNGISKNVSVAQAVSFAKQRGIIPADASGDSVLTIQKAAYLLTGAKTIDLINSHYDWQIRDLDQVRPTLKKYLLAAYSKGLLTTAGGYIRPNQELYAKDVLSILARLKNPGERILPPNCAAPYFEYRGLVEVIRLDPTVIIDQRYATKNNFTGVAHYQRSICLLEAVTARRLCQANAYFKQKGRRIKIWDGYRPVSVQWSLYYATPANLKQYAPAPSKYSQHSKGIAADITLTDKNGIELPMPTGFDNFTAKAHSDYSGLSSRIIANRSDLKTGMTKQGFAQSKLEWWHFYSPDKTGLSISKVELNDFSQRENDFYQNYLSHNRKSPS
ncbi:MAG TPA: M15 family metallopeptidase [Clostridia bacterium]|nr:M15 family metallopeptidase [Clostridia bacterium]